MTIDDIIASLRRMEEEIARLRVQVATLTAAPATGGPVPGTFTDEEIEEYIVTTGAGCVLELAKDVQRARGEVYRLRALLTVPAFTAAPTTTTDGVLLPCPFCGRTDTLEMAGARSHYVICNCGGACVAGPSGDTESEAITRWNTRALLTTPTPSPAPERVFGADPARGGGVSARACWDCAHTEGRLSDCFAPYTAATLDWIHDNTPAGRLRAGARNCPGWAPKSGEVSDG